MPRTLTAHYGYRRGDKIICNMSCVVPPGYHPLHLVRVNSICTMCGAVYKGRGVWACSRETAIMPRNGTRVTVRPRVLSPEQLAEKFANLPAAVRTVEIDRVQKASLYDLLEHVAEFKNPHDCWANLCKNFPEVLVFSENLFIFKGSGQKATPVVSLQEWLHILMLVKKPVGAEVRQVGAEVLEVKLNEVMGAVGQLATKNTEIHEAIQSLVTSIEGLSSRLRVLEDQSKRLDKVKFHVSSGDILEVIRHLFESSWKEMFNKAKLITCDEDYKKYNSEWKRMANGAERENWAIRHYIQVCVHIENVYNVGIMSRVIYPFIEEENVQKVVGSRVYHQLAKNVS